jgi:rhomboid domain-containing protein 1
MRREKPKQAIFYLLFELFRNEKIPPVTLAVIALNVLIYLEYFDSINLDLASVCLSVNAVLNRRQWMRLLFSPFFHADDWHLYYNMSSFSIKGRTLEKKYGSVYFLVLLIVFTINCSLMLLALEYLAFYFLGRHSFLDTCAVGFSGVIFALKVLTTHDLPPGTVHMFGTIPLPNKYAYWAELILISLLTPNASFAGIFLKLNYTL